MNASTSWTIAKRNSKPVRSWRFDFCGMAATSSPICLHLKQDQGRTSGPVSFMLSMTPLEAEEMAAHLLNTSKAWREERAKIECGRIAAGLTKEDVES